MMLHADYAHFMVGTPDPKYPAAVNLSRAALASRKPADKDGWDQLATAALATGAFPVGFTPRLLEWQAGIYQGRTWRVPGLRLVGGVSQCGATEVVRPDWEFKEKDPYQFLCVDGGVLDNQPLGLARMLLAGEVFCRQPPLPRARQRKLACGRPERIGDFTVTALPVDHSVFGAVAFLIEKRDIQAPRLEVCWHIFRQKRYRQILSAGVQG